MSKLSLLCLCSVLALAACGGGEKAASDKPAETTTSTAPAESAKSEGDPAINKELDAGLAQVQAQLPMKLGEVMEMSSIKRNGTTVEYVYTFFTDAMKKETFKAEDGKQAGKQQICSHPQFKKYMDAGYSFNFKFNFKDGSSMDMPFTAGDC